MRGLAGLVGVMFPLLAVASGPVVVDVGHSLVRPGATSARGVTEFTFNLALAREVGRALRHGGGRVSLIGQAGDLDSLRERGKRAADLRPGLLLSIHHDSMQPGLLKTWVWAGRSRPYGEASGYSLFVSRKNVGWRWSLSCASAVGKELRRRGFRKSSHHAADIPGERKEWADEANGVYWYDNLVMLKSVDAPSMLLEAGVIVNRDEERHLQLPATRRGIATAVRAGLLACGMVAPHK